MNSISNKSVFVIVVSYNGEHWVDRCFGSLRLSTYPVQTILVDNNSSDATAEKVRIQFPEVEVIANTSNAGFGKANNQGIALALARGASAVFLLNQDAWVEPGTIGLLMTALEDHPEHGIISPMHYTGSGSALDRNFEKYILNDASAESVSRWQHDNIHEVHKVAFVNAAAWLISAACLEKTGGFGPLFFHYGEDHDFVHRMEFFKFSTGVVAGTKIFHDREFRTADSLRSTPAKLFRYYYVGSLVRMADIRSWFTGRLVHIVYWNTKDSLALLLKGRWIAPLVTAVVLSRSLGMIPRILQYRYQAKRTAAFRFIK